MTTARAITRQRRARIVDRARRSTLAEQCKRLPIEVQVDAILIELNPAYAEMAERRVHGDAPLLTHAEGV